MLFRHREIFNPSNAMTSHPSLVLLNRHLATKENAPFTLIIDSLLQSAYHLLQEFVHRSNGQVIYLSFETTVKPEYATSYMDCSCATVKQIQQFLEGLREASSVSSKTMIVIDSLNYLDEGSHASFISQIVHPSSSVIACYHKNVPSVPTRGYPPSLNLLSFIALAILEVEPLTSNAAEDLDSKISRFQFPPSKGLNLTRFKLQMTSRRKSGKSLVNAFVIDTQKHEYEVYKSTEDNPKPEDEELLKDLTTFNLTTNTKQRLAREQVELPFMEAQTELGKYGGAIVYEFEKDDDYDEEDPYEDPF